MTLSPQTENDATAIADVFRDQRYDSESVLNPDKGKFNAAIKQMCDKLQRLRLAKNETAVGVFYYSGHGLQAAKDDVPLNESNIGGSAPANNYLTVTSTKMMEDSVTVGGGQRLWRRWRNKRG